ncbi:MAG: helix-turn-helix transcriptional regulator [Bacteroidales bacterium]|nr:helix-turn-helix transcriptional regulator [Bacteroidales bacterium]
MHREIKSIDELNALFRQPTTHAMVAVGDLSQADLALFQPTDFGMYCVVLMDENFGELVKGGKVMRYQAGTAFSLRPGQVVSMNLDYRTKPRGRMLAFRPELLEKCGLGRDFYMFSFFNSDVFEALELSGTERGVLLNCFANIQTELHTPADYLSTHMLRLGIGHLLSYCKRFFERQFREQRSSGTGLSSRLDEMIDNYLSSGMPAQYGQPSVAWCAGQFNFSANYFGELVKRELHITAQEYILGKIVAAAQALLRETQMSVGEIAEELGFAYANHFTRMFRKRTGISPLAYRRLQAASQPPGKI